MKSFRARADVAAQGLTARIAPGRYAWVSEVPDARAKGMLIPFEVAAR